MSSMVPEQNDDEEVLELSDSEIFDQIGNDNPRHLSLISAHSCKVDKNDVSSDEAIKPTEKIFKIKRKYLPKI